MSGTAKVWTYAKPFHGMPKPDDFKLVEEQVNFSLKPGEIVVEALFLTVDPYMRISAGETGATIVGEQVARVKVSNNKDYPEGTLVLAYVGWRTLTLVTDPDVKMFTSAVINKLPDIGSLSPSVGLGCLGMPGLTAYFGALDRGEIKAGETVLVSGAAGAVGSVVGQIAKIKGCTVIGSAGSKEKCDWIKELGFDHVFNYKETTVDEALKKFAPNGIDMYFDNVGGDFSYSVLKNHMKFRGRVVVCGAISQYNSTDGKVRDITMFLIYKQLDIRGLIVLAYRGRNHEGYAQLLQWIKEDKLKYRETITEGFEHMPDAFISLFKGGNFGKAIVKV